MSWHSTDEVFSKMLRATKVIPPDLSAVEYQPSQSNASVPPPSARKRDSESRPKESKSYFPDGYFQMPNRLFSSGKAAGLTASEGWLYVALCSRNNENSYKTSFRVADRVLANETGMGVATIRAAREKLRGVGLIDFEVRGGKMCRYTVVKIDLERVPADDRKARVKQKPRGRSFAQTEEDPSAGLPQILLKTSLKFAKAHTFSKKVDSLPLQLSLNQVAFSDTEKGGCHSEQSDETGVRGGSAR